MPSASLFRLSALAGVICGLAIAIGGLGEIVAGGKTTATGVLNGLAPAFGLAFLTGLYLAQRRPVGPFGGIAFMLNHIGLALFAGVAFARNFVLVHMEKAEAEELLAGPRLLPFLGAALLTLAGTVLFGAAMYRADVLPRPAVLLYVVGFAPVCLSFVLPALVSRTGHMITGAGIIWLSLALRSLRTTGGDRDEPATPSSRLRAGRCGLVRPWFLAVL